MPPPAPMGGIHSSCFKKEGFLIPLSIISLIRTQYAVNRITLNQTLLDRLPTKYCLLPTENCLLLFDSFIILFHISLPSGVTFCCLDATLVVEMADRGGEAVGAIQIFW